MVGGNDSKLFYLTVGANIKKYRTIRNYSLQDLAERVGLTKKTIQRYENGEIKIDMDRLSDIAEALEVVIPKLVEGAGEMLGIGIQDIDTVQLPVVGKISCGAGNIAFEQIEGYEPTPRSWLNGGQYFYLRAQGDSMTGARIFDGDLVLIREQSEVQDGEIAAVLIGENAYLKRVYHRSGMIILQSENPAYEPVVADGEVKIIGKLKRIVITV